MVRALQNDNTWQIGYRNVAYMVLLHCIEPTEDPWQIIHHLGPDDPIACLWCELRELSFAYWTMPLTAVELQEYSDKFWHRWAAFRQVDVVLGVQQDSAEHLSNVIDCLRDCK